MKRLEITQLELIEQRFIPVDSNPDAIPYAGLPKRFRFMTHRGWLQDKLESAGFDLKKQITESQDPSRLLWIYTQEEEGDEPNDIGGCQENQPSSEVPTDGKLQEMSRCWKVRTQAQRDKG